MGECAEECITMIHLCMFVLWHECLPTYSEGSPSGSFATVAESHSTSQ